MNEHHQQTEFLKHCLRYDESARRHELDQEMRQIQKDILCIKKSVSLMALLMALDLAGYCYGMVLMENFTHSVSQFILNSLCAVGAGSLISLMVFFCLGRVYRRKLDRRREECRLLVTRALETRLGGPDKPARPEVGRGQASQNNPPTQTILPSP